MENLNGRVVIVSHADTDHGAALAEAMCSAGAAAILTGQKFHDLGALAKRLYGETGAPIAVFAGDLSRDDVRQALALRVSELFPH